MLQWLFSKGKATPSKSPETGSITENAHPNTQFCVGNRQGWGSPGDGVEELWAESSWRGFW
jgi:hypothetical protein